MMGLGGGAVIGERHFAVPLEPVAPRNYPRAYASSSATRKSFWMLLAAQCLLAALAHAGGSGIVVVVFLVPANLAAYAYYFGTRITLRATEIEARSWFFFTRRIARKEMIGWQLKLNSVRGVDVFSLVLRSAKTTIVFDLNFQPDTAFFAWVPELDTLIEQYCMQWPGLQEFRG